MLNKEFAEKDELFRKACERAGLPNHKNVIRKRDGITVSTGMITLTRQASKWRMKKGLAYQFRNEVENEKSEQK